MSQILAPRLRYGTNFYLWGNDMEPEITIQSLLDKIKEEGFQEAEKISQKIISEAEAKAELIIREAEKNAEHSITTAREEVMEIQDAFEVAMTQGGRNLILSLHDEIIRLFGHILERKVASSLRPDLMRDMIMTITENWEIQDKNRTFEILVNEKDARELEGLLYDSLQNEFKKGIAIKPLKTIRAGFRIGEKDGNVHYDFTPEGIAEILREHLNPRFSRFLEEMS
jgi:V/A-type H+/Na+-transporting ATPase subunit E